MASALDQTLPAERVVVVVDRADGRAVDGLLPADPRLLVLATGVDGAGAAAARNLGVAHALGELVAFLDDDDEWLPRKLEVQVALHGAARAAGRAHAVVGCRAVHRTPEGRLGATTPRRLVGADETVATYLFRRREVRPGATALGSSMLLVDAALARAVPFGSALQRHDDWDWLLRATEGRDVAVVHAPEVLLRYTVQPPGRSRSSARGWQTSAAWAHANASRLSRRELGDLLLTVTAPVAVTHGDARGAAAVVHEAFRAGRPGPHAVAFLGVLAASRAARAALDRAAGPRRRRPAPG